MKTIELDVEGIPEPFVHAVRKMVEDLREQLQENKAERPRVELLVRDGTVLTPLTREEIYRDVGRVDDC